MIIKSKSILKDNENGLYLVSTPIGNLKDITLRAIETLKKSTYILCEDTRVSRILLDRYEIKSRLISNHKFNELKNLSKIIDLLKSGETIALVSDAGTPSISDPGAILVNECVKNNIKIIPIPGPSAVATAVSISGFSEKFIFYGFLPEKIKAITGDLVRIETEIGHFVTRAWVTECIAPNVVACSHHMGRWRLAENQGTDRWFSSLVDLTEKGEGKYLLRQKKGVSPFSARTVTSASAASKACTFGALSDNAASCSGVFPHLSRAIKSAPTPNKAWTLAKLPLEATKCSGVRPKSSCSMKSAPAVKSVGTFLELFH